MNREELFKKIESAYTAWQESQEGQTDGVKYEKTFLEFWEEAGKNLLEHSLGKTKPRESTNVQTKLGKVNAPKSHVIAKTPFKLSPLLQTLALYVGQLVPFQEASDCFFQMSGIEVNAKSIERVCHHYGQKLEEDKAEVSETSFQKGMHYCMVDGSMILTREEKWKEIKLGRIFSSASSMELYASRNIIRQSDYTVHLGDCAAFFEKLGPKIALLESVVWISDGAPWIWNWVENNCPSAVQILDYFHCKEKLCKFATESFKFEQERNDWIKKQENYLFQDNVEQVIENMLLIQETPSKTNTITYFKNNKDRMRYGTYRKKNYMIGSGPIEAANKNIIQKRLKLSGQRWTKSGAQQVANIRACYHSNNWNKIVNYVNSY